MRAREAAFGRLLAHHLLHRTVCDNNGPCTAHSTTRLRKVQHQTPPFRPVGSFLETASLVCPFFF